MHVQRDMDRFHFLKNDRYVMKTTTKKQNTKRSFSKTTVFLKFVVSLTIVNETPSLTTVDEERRIEETDLNAIGTYH